MVADPNFDDRYCLLVRNLNLKVAVVNYCGRSCNISQVYAATATFVANVGMVRMEN